MKSRTSRANNLIESGKYDQAASLLRQVVSDSEETVFEKADAYQLLGLLAYMDPASVGTDDAFSFYKQSVDLVPDHIWSLLGIAMTYGDHAPDHQDYDAFESAMRQLLMRLNELNEDAVASVLQRKKRLRM